MKKECEAVVGSGEIELISCTKISLSGVSYGVKAIEWFIKYLLD